MPCLGCGRVQKSIILRTFDDKNKLGKDQSIGHDQRPPVATPVSIMTCIMSWDYELMS